MLRVQTAKGGVELCDRSKSHPQLHEAMIAQKSIVPEVLQVYRILNRVVPNESTAQLS